MTLQLNDENTRAIPVALLGGGFTLLAGSTSTQLPSIGSQGHIRVCAYSADTQIFIGSPTTAALAGASGTYLPFGMVEYFAYDVNSQISTSGAPIQVTLLR